MRNKRFPKYPDDTDYNTNANSYYDDLARKQKLIEMLAKKIWEYEETLDLTLEQITNRLETYIEENDNLMTDRLEQWDLNLEKFPENVELLLQEWLSDGTLDHIINETIFNWKADKTYVDAEIERLDQKDEDLTEQKADKTFVDTEIERLDQKDEDLTTHLAQNAVYMSSFSELDDVTAVEQALNLVKKTRGKLLGEKGKTYTIDKSINIDMDEDDTFVWDLNGSTIDFINGGSITIGNNDHYKSSGVTNGLINGQTNFTVENATGVKKGDLVTVHSPVEWVGGITLEQTYTISDVDGNNIYVDGLIVGDITREQMSEAGVTGEITAKFYKLSKRLTIKNGTLMSSNRDSSDVLLSVLGQDQYLIENITVETPKRMGVYIQYSGTGQITNCYTVDHGYATKDEGYGSRSHYPEGTGFGYGFIVAYNYYTEFINCHSFSGWHGFDGARGQTFLLFKGCTVHKDAYGFSTHEGSWDITVDGCQILGGLGITSRSAELTVINNVFKTNIGQAITGNTSHQRLLIKNNIFDVTNNKNSSSLFYFTGSYEEYCYSNKEPYTEISNNTAINIDNPSTIRITRGDMIFKGNSFKNKENGDDHINIQVTNGNVIINNNNFTNVSQFAFQVSDCNDLYVSGNEVSGVVKTYGSSALLLLTERNFGFVGITNNISTQTEYFVRINHDIENPVNIMNNNVGRRLYLLGGVGNINVATNNTLSESIGYPTGKINESINNNIVIYRS